MEAQEIATARVAADANANPLAPIVVKVAVPCAPERAFACFTRDIARWWPRATHSVSEAACQDVAIEPRIGGAIVETADNGTRHPWGTITRWEPGAALAFSWHPGRTDETAQWVEILFAPTTTGTLVTLTQGGWEALGEMAAKARGGYNTGWTMILGDLYAAYCARAST
jgi:hypothetical protein